MVQICHLISQNNEFKPDNDLLLGNKKIRIGKKEYYRYNEIIGSIIYLLWIRSFMQMRFDARKKRAARVTPESALLSHNKTTKKATGFRPAASRTSLDTQEE